MTFNELIKKYHEEAVNRISIFKGRYNNENNSVLDLASRWKNELSKEDINLDSLRLLREEALQVKMILILQVLVFATLLKTTIRKL